MAVELCSLLNLFDTKYFLFIPGGGKLFLKKFLKVLECSSDFSNHLINIIPALIKH